VALVAAGILTMPAAVATLGAGLDASWKVGLSLSAARHSQWGVQTLFTYGPLGYLDNLEFIATRHWIEALTANILIHVVFIAALAVYLWDAAGGVLAWLFMAAVLLLPSRVLPSLEYDALLASLVLLFVASTSNRGRLRVAAAITGGVLLGALATVKGTALASGLGLLLAFFIVSWSRDRRRLAPFAGEQLQHCALPRRLIIRAAGHARRRQEKAGELLRRS